MNPKYKKLHKKMQKCFQTSFPRYNQILRYTDLLPILYPCNVRVEKIGMSLQGRPIRMLVLQADATRPKQGAMIEAGIHAREWLAHSTILYIIDKLLATKTMLNYMDFYIIPCVNPDGYEYTHTSCRLWRKNLNHNNSKDVKKWGVDLNRNFPVAFGHEGSSRHRDSARYHGASALSEPETQSLANALGKYSCRVRLYISLHCFGHLIMYPWSHTTDSLWDERDLLNCAVAAQKAMKCNTPKSKFTVGQLSKAMCKHRVRDDDGLRETGSQGEVRVHHRASQARTKRFRASTFRHTKGGQGNLCRH
ncbi:carboxypeptidase B-like isoform X2 [Photinus pyralis]|uniref:carboxypeptidase B-like isoform X2 n=1 Tax=Photinus pyralis TaxID=7054 RepID=UPI0012670176|nr:carboxypeptidase B-like isoform X2 [Photinus pyralis]